MEFSFRSIFRLALPVLSGLAILATPKAAFSSLPGFSQAILSNGMLVGILVSILLEVGVPWQTLEGR
jgi:xanthine/uracil permease